MNGEFLKDLFVHVGNVQEEGVALSKNPLCVGFAGPAVTGQILQLKCSNPGPLPGKYVTLQINHNAWGYLAINEVIVIDTSMSGNP